MQEKGVLVAAISAIDIALWDIKGKYFNSPIHTLLGGAMRKNIVPYATGLYFKDSNTLKEDLVSEALGYVEQGFKAIKMKVGYSLKKDIDHIQSIRSAIGDDIELMIDANHAYAYPEALRLAKAVEQYNISWFEEPVSPEQYDHYRRLRDNTSIPIAGGECEYLRYGFLQLLKSESVDILQVDICAAGGLTEAKRIAALACTYGVAIIPHTWGTGIAFQAAMHFISNLEPVPGRLVSPDFYIEYDRTENGIRERLTTPVIEISNGKIALTEKPGLGIEVNEDVVVSYVDKTMKILILFLKPCDVA